MAENIMKLLWLVPLCVVASIVVSLLAVWLVGQATDFRFDPVSVIVFSGSISASTVIVKAWTRQHK